MLCASMATNGASMTTSGTRLRLLGPLPAQGDLEFVTSLARTTVCRGVLSRRAAGASSTFDQVL